MVARRTRGGAEHQHLVMRSKAKGTVCVYTRLARFLNKTLLFPTLEMQTTPFNGCYCSASETLGWMKLVCAHTFGEMTIYKHLVR